MWRLLVLAVLLTLVACDRELTADQRRAAAVKKNETDRAASLAKLEGKAVFLTGHPQMADGKIIGVLFVGAQFHARRECIQLAGERPDSVGALQVIKGVLTDSKGEIYADKWPCATCVP